MLAGTEDFTISEDSGNVNLAQNAVLNQTLTQTYSFSVTATDGGTPALSSSVNVTISIIKGL